MKLMTFEKQGKQIVGVVDKSETKVADINSLGLSAAYPSMDALIEHVTPADMEKLRSYAAGKASAGQEYPLQDVKFLPPIPRPRHDVLCLGTNFHDVVKKTGMAPLKDPIFFGKRAAKMTGHNGTLDGVLDIDEQFDYELELCVVIGKEGYRIPPEKVEEHIFGYSVFDDYTSRGVQARCGQWYQGKGGDTLSAMGPWIVTKDELPITKNFILTLRVNGEVRQHSGTDDFIFDLKTGISKFSETITLEPGDIIATGTPFGCACNVEPRRWLKSGDKVENEIEGIGVMVNWVK